MNNIEPASVQDHGRGFESVKVPLVARDEAAQSIAGSRIVNGERLDRAKNAADEDERRRAVEHDAKSTDVRSKHAVAHAKAVSARYQADE